MLKIKIIALGKLKEKFYAEACDEYLKRLTLYCETTVKELPEGPSLLSEAKKIKQEIPQGAYVIAMCIEGDSMSSTQLATLLQTIQNNGKSKLCIILGSSDGMSEEIKELADCKLSMSKMTFPHHLARVLILEQIYRAMSITSGGKYHK